MKDALTIERGEGEVDASTSRPADLRAARLHLRTGSYILARVELETLAGAGALDEEALLDLAEIRWRTGDLIGAGEAAAAYLGAGHEALVALVIACEATAALGRPAEARQLAGRALELADGPLDPIFAGRPRSSIWPAEPPERVEPFHAGQPFQPLSGTVPVAAMLGDTSSAGGGQSADSAAVVAGAAAAAGLVAQTGADEVLPDPGEELELARAAIALGDRSSAVIHLSVVLRLAPALAAAVLEIAAAESGPAFDLVRGDALRIVGRETQARRAYAAAARLARDRRGHDDEGPVDDHHSAEDS